MRKTCGSVWAGFLKHTVREARGRRPRSDQIAPRWVACWGLGLLLGACGGDDRPAPLGDRNAVGDVPFARLPPTTSDYAPAPCPYDPPAGVPVECARVSVPEDPANADGPRIALSVARLFSTSSTIAEDPVVYLEGGPGGDALATILGNFEVFSHLLATRDLVTFDQRGTGHSRPRLDCTELDSITVAVGGSEEAAVLDALSSCRERLEADGVDLDTYRSSTIAADVEALRIALGYSTWNLYGISYGTRLGLTVLRDHPESVRSAVLDGVLPVELEIFGTAATSAERSFATVFALCAADAACAAAFPDPMAQLEATVDGMNATPGRVTLTDGSTVAVTGSMVLNTMFLLLYDAGSIPYLPELIDLVASGDLSIFRELFSAMGAEPIVALGMYLSVVCAEDAPFSSADAVRASAEGLAPMFAAFADPAIFEECARWSVTPAPAVEDEPVVSAIPTLLTSGTFDPVTPPENGDLVAASLLAGEHVVLPYESHGASTSACGSELVDRFLAAPDQPVARGCVARLTPRPFEVGRRTEAPPFRFHRGAVSAEELREIADRARRRLRDGVGRRPH